MEKEDYTFAPNLFRRGNVVIYACDKIAFALNHDGAVILGDGWRPDEAGRLAAEQLAKTFPDIVKGAVAAERERCAKIANNELVDGLSAEEAAGAIREAILDPSNP